MKNSLKKIIKWIIETFLGILGFYLFLCLAFFAISVIPSIIFSPFIVYEIIKDPSNWSDISLYSKLVITLGSIIFLGIIIIQIIGPIITGTIKLIINIIKNDEA